MQVGSLLLPLALLCPPQRRVTCWLPCRNLRVLREESRTPVSPRLRPRKRPVGSPAWAPYWARLLLVRSQSFLGLLSNSDPNSSGSLHTEIKAQKFSLQRKNGRPWQRLQAAEVQACSLGECWKCQGAVVVAVTGWHGADAPPSQGCSWGSGRRGMDGESTPKTAQLTSKPGQDTPDLLPGVTTDGGPRFWGDRCGRVHGHVPTASVAGAISCSSAHRGRHGQLEPEGVGPPVLVLFGLQAPDLSAKPGFRAEPGRRLEIRKDQIL